MWKSEFLFKEVNFSKYFPSLSSDICELSFACHQFRRVIGRWRSTFGWAALLVDLKILWTHWTPSDLPDLNKRCGAAMNKQIVIICDEQSAMDVKQSSSFRDTIKATGHCIRHCGLHCSIYSVPSRGWVGLGGGGGDNTVCTPQWLDHRTGDQMVAQLFRDKLHSNITCNIHLNKTNILLHLKQVMTKMRSL